MVLFLVVERFAVQTVAIKKNLLVLFLVFQQFAVQTIAIKKNQSIFFVFEWFTLQTVGMKKNLIPCYFLYLSGLQWKWLTIRQMLSIFRFCA